MKQNREGLLMLHTETSQSYPSLLNTISCHVKPTCIATTTIRGYPAIATLRSERHAVERRRAGCLGLAAWNVLQHCLVDFNCGHIFQLSHVTHVQLCILFIEVFAPFVLIKNDPRKKRRVVRRPIQFSPLLCLH